MRTFAGDSEENVIARSPRRLLRKAKLRGRRSNLN